MRPELNGTAILAWLCQGPLRLYCSNEYPWGTGEVLVCLGVAGQWAVPAEQTLTCWPQ